MSARDTVNLLWQKQAERLADDESRLVPGKMDLYPDPAGRAPGTIDARWGDAPNPDKAPLGTGTLREINRGRGEMLEKLFESFGSSSAAARAGIAQDFAPGYETKAPMLHPHIKTAAPHTPTLTERVRAVVGRR